MVTRGSSSVRRSGGTSRRSTGSRVRTRKGRAGRRTVEEAFGLAPERRKGETQKQFEARVGPEGVAAAQAAERGATTGIEEVGATQQRVEVISGVQLREQRRQEAARKATEQLRIAFTRQQRLEPITPRPTPQRQTGFGLAMAADFDAGVPQPRPPGLIQRGRERLEDLRLRLTGDVPTLAEVQELPPEEQRAVIRSQVTRIIPVPVAPLSAIGSGVGATIFRRKGEELAEREEPPSTLERIVFTEPVGFIAGGVAGGVAQVGVRAARGLVSIRGQPFKDLQRTLTKETVVAKGPVTKTEFQAVVAEQPKLRIAGGGQARQTGRLGLQARDFEVAKAGDIVGTGKQISISIPTGPKTTRGISLGFVRGTTGPRFTRTRLFAGVGEAAERETLRTITPEGARLTFEVPTTGAGQRVRVFEQFGASVRKGQRALTEQRGLGFVVEDVTPAFRAGTTAARPTRAPTAALALETPQVPSPVRPLPTTTISQITKAATTRPITPTFEDLGGITGFAVAEQLPEPQPLAQPQLVRPQVTRQITPQQLIQPPRQRVIQPQLDVQIQQPEFVRPIIQAQPTRPVLTQFQPQLQAPVQVQPPIQPVVQAQPQVQPQVQPSFVPRVPTARAGPRFPPLLPPFGPIPKLFERPKQVRPGRGFQRLGFTPSVVGLEIFTQTGEALTRAPEFVTGFGVRLPVVPTRRRRTKKKRGKK